MSLSEQSQSAFRKRVFWTVACFFMGLVVLGYVVEKNFVYAPSEKKLRYGTYGLYLADQPVGEDGCYRIAMLGNSVYQTCEIVEIIQCLAASEGRSEKYINYGQAGCGIYDYLANLAIIADSKPDMVVIGFVNLAFSQDHKFTDLPRFRTDSNMALFDLDSLSPVFLPLYLQLVEGGGEALAGSLIRLKRMDWLLLRETKKRLVQTKILPAWNQQMMHARKLNLAMEWQKTAQGEKVSPEQYRVYPEARELVRVLGEFSKRRHVPVLLVRQVGGPGVSNPPVMAMLREEAEMYPLLFVEDQWDYYEDKSSKKLHPHSEKERNLYAATHYSAIRKTIDIVAGMAAEK